MDKIKICLAIPGSHTDRKLWSGTHHTLFEELQKERMWNYLFWNII